MFSILVLNNQGVWADVRHNERAYCACEYNPQNPTPAGTASWGTCTDYTYSEAELTLSLATFRFGEFVAAAQKQLLGVFSIAFLIALN